MKALANPTDPDTIEKDIALLKRNLRRTRQVAIEVIRFAKVDANG